MGIPGNCSINTGQIKEFGINDYVVTLSVLLTSMVVGLILVIKDRYNSSLIEFLFGGRRLHFLPIAMSLFVSYVSSLAILGTPAMVYRNNTMFFWFGVAGAVGSFFSARIFLPMFYSLKIVSVYQYLEIRFSRKVRLVALCFTLLEMGFYSAVVLFAPALAINAVTGFNTWVIIVVIGAVTTVYTTMGGIKAVVWTDSIQAVVIIGGLFVLIVKTASALGGIDKAWRIAEAGSRIKFDEWNFDPRTKLTLWSFLIGMSIFWTCLLGVKQTELQRVLSCPSVRSGQIAYAINGILLTLVLLLLVLVGVVMFAFYNDCNPVSAKLVSSYDQIMPLLVMDVLGDTPGLPGLLMSSVLSASLSTMSTILNAQATIIPDDFIRPFRPNITDRQMTLCAKITVLVCGVIMTGLACLAPYVGSLFHAGTAMMPVTGGPFLGLVSLGMFFPFANAKGALCGHLAGLLFTGWIAGGAFVYKTPGIPTSPEILTDGCAWNFTMNSTEDLLQQTNLTASMKAPGIDDPIYPLYQMSFLCFASIGTGTTIFVGLIISFITGYTKPENVDRRLICPVFGRLFPFLPEVILRPLRFGIDHIHKYETKMQAVPDRTVNEDKKETSRC